MKKPPPVPPDDPDFVTFNGKKFPKETVMSWSDIKKERAIGSGQFGQVYKGFLHLSDYQRYDKF